MKPGVNWETSYLRQWLNNDFYYGAFSETEQAKIINTKLETSDPKETFQTEDKVFVLSASEFEQYLNKKEIMSCKVTAAAKKGLKIDQGAVTQDGLGNWWLRNMVTVAFKNTNGNFMSNTGNQAAYVFGSAGLDVYYEGNGAPVFCDYLVVVRPAIWIYLGE